MCGLAGEVGAQLPMHRLRERLARRGPDHVGELSVGSLRAVHGRLGIMSSRDRAADHPLWFKGRALLCNGYLGNAREVMTALGHAEPASDCTALLAAYLDAAADGLRSLRGQFAGVIVDPVAGELVLVRDQTGICPLYYAESASGLVFGSQGAWVAAPLADAGLPPGLDHAAAEEFASVGYVVAPRTLRAGVRQVEPGTAVVFDLSTGRHRRTLRWGTTPDAVPTTADKVAAALHQAVARNLGGDYQPWVLLSGGLDSLLVLHCAVTAGARPSAVTLVYPDVANADEVRTAKTFARRYAVPLHLVDATSIEQRVDDRLFRSRVDWPMDGGSLLPKIALADFVHRRGGRVVLGGTGADELFGGYSRHQRRLEMLPPGASRGDDDTERVFFDRCIAPSPHAEAVWQRFEEQGSRYRDAGFVYDLLEISMHHNPRVDSCFANTAVEYRPVFQDADLVAMAAGLTLGEKSRVGTPKSLLRQAFAGQLDETFLSVPKRPLRFGRMGPHPAWRRSVFESWLTANALSSAADRR